MNEMIKQMVFRKKRSLDLALGMRQDLQKLGFSGDLEKQILASALRRINEYLDAEGVDRLTISGIPEV